MYSLWLNNKASKVPLLSHEKKIRVIFEHHCVVSCIVNCLVKWDENKNLKLV